MTQGNPMARAETKAADDVWVPTVCLGCYN